MDSTEIIMMAFVGIIITGVPLMIYLTERDKDK